MSTLNLLADFKVIESKFIPDNVFALVDRNKIYLYMDGKLIKIMDNEGFYGRPMLENESVYLKDTKRLLELIGVQYD